MQGSGAQAATPEHVRDVVERVLHGPDFREQSSPIMEAIGEFFDWFFGLFEGLGIEPDGSALEAGIELIWIGILVIATGLLLWVIWKYARDVRERKRQVSLSLTDEVATRVRDLRAQAHQAQQSGDHTLALRLYFFALVIGLGQRGELEYNSAWTNRELLERGEPRQEVVELLRPLVGELDAHSFGEQPTQPAEVQRFADLCENLLGGVAA